MTSLPAHEVERLLIFQDGLMAFCTVGLALKVPRIADPKTQQAAVLAWGGLLFLLNSFLLSLFRVKNGGYPFSLPPFM